MNRRQRELTALESHSSVNNPSKSLSRATITFRQSHLLIQSSICIYNVKEQGYSVILQFYSSFTASCPAGVPQGSAISPALFNIYINDMGKMFLNRNIFLHTSIRIGESSDLQSALNSVQSWAVENKMELNAKKTKDMWINFTEAPPPLPLHIGDAILERVDNFKLLGTWFQKDLKWNKHIEETTRTAAKNLYCLRECRRANLPFEVGLTTYLTKITPILEYCSSVWGGLPRYLKDELERVQRRSLRIIGLPHGYLPTLEERRIEATSRELDTILGDPSHISINELWNIINITIILGVETVYLNTRLSQALHDTEIVLSHEQ